MLEHLPEFEWRVDETGYRWLETYPFSSGHSESSSEHPRHDWYLSDQIAAHVHRLSKPCQRVLRPLESFDGLFNEFARTTPTQEGIKHFADRFGLLGPSIEIRVIRPGAPPQLVWGEPLTAWRKEITLMREAVALWDSIRRRDIDAMRQFSYLDRSTGTYGAVGDWPFFAVDYALQEFTRSLIREGFEKGVPVQWAEEALAEIVNRQLGHRCWPELRPVGPAAIVTEETLEAFEAIAERAQRKLEQFPKERLTRIENPSRLGGRPRDRNRLEHIDFSEWAHSLAEENLYGPSSSAIEPDLHFGNEKPLGLQIIPISLIGALWLQLALAINGNKKYRRCEKCQLPFEVKPKARHQRYCSAACKQAAFRERKDKTLGEEKP